MARSHVRLRNLSVKVSEQETQHYRELLAEMDRELERLRGLEATSTPPAEEATSPGAGSK
jgi:hypothetical protein